MALLIGSLTHSLTALSVLACVACEVVAPQPERPTEGFFKFDVEFASMSNVSAEAGRQNVRGVALSRVVEKSLRDSDAIDVESLCIIAGEKVWSIRCNAHVLDDGGNALDCVSLAVAAALLHFRRPDITVDGRRVIFHSTHERQPVPLGIHHLPLCVSVDFFDVDDEAEFTEADLYVDDANDASLQQRRRLTSAQRLNDNFLLDATTLEHDACRGTVTMAFNAHGELCLINKSGGVPLTASRLLQIASIAKERASTATDAVRDALDRAGVKLPRAFHIASSADSGQLYKPSSTPLTAAGSDAAAAQSSAKTSHRINVDGGGRTTLSQTEAVMTVNQVVDPTALIDLTKIRAPRPLAVDDDDDDDAGDADVDDIDSKAAFGDRSFGLLGNRNVNDDDNDDNDDDDSEEAQTTTL
jgi:exosome complex component RRP45